MNGPSKLGAFYKGRHWRSHLEARWAVFFDKLGIVWAYEPQGYKMADGSTYLPDFLLPRHQLWAEVRPSGEHFEFDLNRLGRFVRERSLSMDGTRARRWPSSLLVLGDIPNVSERSAIPCHSIMTLGHAFAAFFTVDADIVCTMRERDLDASLPDVTDLYAGTIHPLVRAAYDAAHHFRYDPSRRMWVA